MDKLHLEVHPKVEHAARPCERCGAPIVLAWLTGRKGRRMPVDLEPDPDGNVMVAVTGSGQVVARMKTLDRPEPEGTERVHLPHFATCGRLRSEGGPSYLARQRARQLQRQRDALDPTQRV